MKIRIPKHPIHPLLAKPRRYLTSAALVVLAVGLTGATLSTVDALQTNESLMLARASTAASALSADEIKALVGGSSDLENPDYQNIKQRLSRIRQENPGTRLINLFGQRPDGQIFYYLNSEPEIGRNYAPPGLINVNASNRLFASFRDDNPFLEGPIRDGYGLWISALAPVRDDATGETVAILAIDVNAYDYYLQIAPYTLIPLLLAAIPLAVLLRNRRLEAKEREVLEIKSQFVSVASHELRSPLTGALWGVQSLIKPGSKNQNISAKQKNVLTAVYSSIATSLASVNEVLDFSVFERRKADNLQRIEVNLVDVLHDIQKVLDLSAEEAKVSVKFVDDWPEQVMTVGDPSALKRAFSNILSNAIKYSSKNTGIELGYKQENGNHIISICDHGIGIPKEEQAKVLAGYYRATNASKKLEHGTGMGLWISRLIVEQHKGKLLMESKINHGTTVEISLPSHNTTDD